MLRREILKNVFFCCTDGWSSVKLWGSARYNRVTSVPMILYFYILVSCRAQNEWKIICFITLKRMCRLASNRKFLKRVDDIKFFVILSFMLCRFAIFLRTCKEISLGLFGINTKSAFHQQFFITYFFSKV